MNTHSTPASTAASAVDLHVHSLFSDGTDSPEELVHKAAQGHLSAIALTDHDTIDGAASAVAAGNAAGLEVIPGVELSTFFDRIEIHIVGLFVNYQDPDFTGTLHQLKEIRSLRNRQMCQRFEEIGIPLHYEDLIAAYGDAAITRAHFADYLLKMGVIKSRNEAFARYIGPHGPCFVPRQKMDPAEGIRIIHKAGGVAVLAHPILYHLGSTQMTRLLDYLCANGLQGIEAVYSTYSNGETVQMENLARRYGLLLSGGSDYHGKNKPDISLGTGRGHLFVPYRFLEGIRSAAASVSTDPTI